MRVGVKDVPIEYMPVTDDDWEGPLSPPFPSKAAVARWAGISPNCGNWARAGASRGFKIVEVNMD